MSNDSAGLVIIVLVLNILKSTHIYEGDTDEAVLCPDGRWPHDNEFDNVSVFIMLSTKD